MAAVKKERVVIGLSGGVDSSAAAALLVEAGYDVVGITLKLWAHGRWLPGTGVDRREQAVADARAVCQRLGIPHYTLDESAEFERCVVQYFADEYKAGRTPNPCARCNLHLKFGRLLQQAEKLGAQWVATGHHARREQSPESRSALRVSDLSAAGCGTPLGVPQIVAVAIPRPRVRESDPRLGCETPLAFSSVKSSVDLAGVFNVFGIVCRVATT